MSEANPASLQSMTGYGAAEGDAGPFVWRWELRSVNGKGLDLKFRIPAGLEGLEQGLRQRLRDLHRGSVSINLRMEREASEEPLRVDEEALAAVAAALNKVRQYVDCDKPRPEAILAMRGVLSAPPPEFVLTELHRQRLIESFDQALAAHVEARRDEGSRIVNVLRERCSMLQSLTESIRQQTLDTREQLAERLRSQLADLLAEHVADERLAQEAALLAIKADVSEELDRLAVHAQAFLELLSADGAAGRRLEFLTQELMREASTLTAKLHSAELKGQALDLKELVDSLREQVLNIA